MQKVRRIFVFALHSSTKLISPRSDDQALVRDLEHLYAAKRRLDARKASDPTFSGSPGHQFPAQRIGTMPAASGTTEVRSARRSQGFSAKTPGMFVAINARIKLPLTEWGCIASDAQRSNTSLQIFDTSAMSHLTEGESDLRSQSYQDSRSARSPSKLKPLRKLSSLLTSRRSP